MGAIRPAVPEKAQEEIASNTCESVVQAWDQKKGQLQAEDDHPFDDAVPECRIVVGNWKVDGERFSPKFAVSMHQSHVPQKEATMALRDAENDTVSKVDKDLPDDKSILVLTRNKSYPRANKRLMCLRQGTRTRRFERSFPIYK